MRRSTDVRADKSDVAFDVALNFQEETPMKSFQLTRRALNAGAVAVAAIAAVGGYTAASADQKVIKIGMIDTGGE